MISRAEFTHRSDQGGEVVRIDVGCDAVSQVENVARAAAKTFQGIPDFPADHVRIGQQDGRVQVALQRDLSTDSPTRLGEGHGPVQSDRVATAVCNRFLLRIAAFTEQNERDGLSLVLAFLSGDDLLRVAQ